MNDEQQKDNTRVNSVNIIRSDLLEVFSKLDDILEQLMIIAETVRCIKERI